MPTSPLVILAKEVEQARAPWGLAIYRTTYSPFSDTHFDAITELITALAKYSVRKWKNMNPNDPAKLAAKSALQETYQPIILNDKAEFDGMTFEAIRAHHQALVKRPVGERPLTNKYFCVVVDDEVVQTLAGANPAALIATENILVDYSKYWVKAIESDLEDEDDKGWMKCSVYALWNLWIDMDDGRPMRSYEALYPRGVYCG
ncbi:uncharacterized protein BDW70DRAFT_145417 [Aspergillus foveolatus]|uniref:uncharacterized protein n=1 Tax=Aspergillus foveolatus TaxID=210207 RepID=UPI003CCCC53A